jgi:hypothetical protein
MTDRETNTLATRGLEEHFSSCAVVSVFLVVAEIVLGDTYLPYQLCCCVLLLLRQAIDFGCTGWFFGCGGKRFWVLLPYLPYQLCRCVSFLVAAGNSFWLLRLEKKRLNCRPVSGVRCPSVRV